MITEKSVDVKIDWITITKPSLELSGENEVAMQMYDFDNIELWDSATAPYPYKYGVRNAIGALGGSQRKGQGTLIQWSGSACAMIDTESILSLARLNDWRITRLDCAVDFIGFDTTVEDYRQEFANDQCNTTARNHDEHKSENSGHTLYIGSFKSARFLRIYNKTASEARFIDADKIPDKWVRCELRLGDDYAKNAASYLLQTGVTDGIPDLIRGYADFPNIEEYQSISKQPKTVLGSGKKDTKTRKWLVTQVLSTLARECYLDPEFRREYMGMLDEAINVISIKS